MVTLLLNAKNSVFSCTFRKKIQNSDVEATLLSANSNSELQRKSFAKKIIEGEEAFITGFLTRTEPSLGRSLVIDLNQEYGKGWRQVDHRTITELTIKNVKYTLKN